MNTHNIQLNYYHPFAPDDSLYLGTAGSHGNEQLKVTLGDGWKGLIVQVIFHPCCVAIQLPEDGLLEVPWEATAKTLTASQGRIVFQGFDADRLVNSTDLIYTVAGHSSTSGRDEKLYTPGIIENVLNQVANDKEEILAAAEAVGSSAISAANSAFAAAESEQKAAETLQQVQAAFPMPSTDKIDQIPTVNNTGDGYLLTGPYCPIDGAIRPTATGNPAVCKDSIIWNFQNFKLYGKSTQDKDSVLSPENPAPIVTAGDGGFIALTITDGAEQSQSITFSTPNCLLGIPVESGGNYVDSTEQHWVSDVVDLIKGTHLQRCCKVLLDGSDDENWIINTVIGAKIIEYTPNLKKLSKSPGLCDSYEVIKDLVSTNTAIGCSFESSSATVRFRPEDYLTISLAAWKARLAEHPIEIVYILDTPITTAISLSSQERTAYHRLTTYSDTTIISTAEPVDIEVQYVADGTKYAEKIHSIDARLSALETVQTKI